MDYIEKINLSLSKGKFVTAEYDGNGHFSCMMRYNSREQIADAIAEEFEADAYDDQQEGINLQKDPESIWTPWQDSFLPDGNPVEYLMKKPSYSVGLADNTILLFISFGL